MKHIHSLQTHFCPQKCLNLNFKKNTEIPYSNIQRIQLEKFPYFSFTLFHLCSLLTNDYYIMNKLLKTGEVKVPLRKQTRQDVQPVEASVETSFHPFIPCPTQGFDLDHLLSVSRQPSSNYSLYLKSPI